MRKIHTIHIWQLCSFSCQKCVNLSCIFRTILYNCKVKTKNVNHMPKLGVLNLSLSSLTQRDEWHVLLKVYKGQIIYLSLQWGNTDTKRLWRCVTLVLWGFSSNHTWFECADVWDMRRNIYSDSISICLLIFLSKTVKWATISRHCIHNTHPKQNPMVQF